MKTNRLIAIMMLAAALCASPVYAQRGGGGGSRGGGHSSSSSRGGGFSSSSSRGGGFSSSSSRGGSSFSSSRSYSSPSSSTRSSSSRSSYSSPSSSRSSSVRGTSSEGSSRYSSSRSGSAVGRPSSTAPGRSDRSSTVGNSAVTRDHNAAARPGSESRPATSRGNRPAGDVTSGKNGGRNPIGTAGRSDIYPQGPQPHGYARPGRPGPMPPSARPMRPAPYFHHPYHGGMIHMHPIFWDPLLPLRPLFWPGFWLYCNSYWYDYHVTDVVVVNRYVKDTYNVDMVSYAVSGDILYAIVNDSDGKTYLQVFDKNDKLLAEQEISKKYVKTEIDRENGGCWIFKKHDKEPMLFLYTDGELLIYEAD